MKTILLYLASALFCMSCLKNVANADEMIGSGDRSKLSLSDKLNLVYTPVFKDDDKRGKLAYGRFYHYLPPLIQFALDIRYGNYEHALSVLPGTGKGAEEIAFWQNVLKGKSGKAAHLICDGFKRNSEFPKGPMKVPDEEKGWLSILQQIETGLLAGSSANKGKKTEASKAGSKASEPNASEPKASEIDARLNPIQCETVNATGALGSCSALSDDLQKGLLVEAFFDQLHNLQRRDTRFIESHYRNSTKLFQYKRYVDPLNVLKLFRALSATTSYSRREHFLRRLRGVARDLRKENLSVRALADEILDDEKDKTTLDRLTRFMDGNQTLEMTTRLSYDLAACGVVEAQVVKAPPISHNDIPAQPQMGN